MARRERRSPTKTKRGGASPAPDASRSVRCGFSFRATLSADGTEVGDQVANVPARRTAEGPLVVGSAVAVGDGAQPAAERCENAHDPRGEYAWNRGPIRV